MLGIRFSRPKKKIPYKKVIAFLGLRPLNKSRAYVSVSAVTLLLILVIYGISSLFITSNNSISEKDQIQQIVNLRNANDCKKGLEVLKTANPDYSKMEYSTTLLSYKADCQQELQRFSEAIATLNTLADYYKKSNKNEELSITVAQIQDVKDAMKYLDTHPNVRNNQVDTKIKAPTL